LGRVRVIPQHDFVVVGGGIVGLTIAREIEKRQLGSVVVLEKEPQIGLHSSGRNSGVLHAGVYYGSDTLKARVCADGAKRMRAYAEEKGIALRNNGKVIVATSPGTEPQIDILLARGRANGVRVEKISPSELRELEPEAVTHGSALHSPDTSVVDSRGVLLELMRDLSLADVPVLLNTEVLEIHPERRLLVTSKGSIGFGYVVNAAGLFADRLAHSAGVGQGYRILPFKGIYRRLSSRAGARFRGSIYPAPDLGIPFLGVHITPGVDGTVYVGPTAIPALGRENYGWLDGIRLGEGTRMLATLAAMAARDQGFRHMVRDELRRYSTLGFLRAARALAPALVETDLLRSGKVGLRAQLVRSKPPELVMDFVLEEGHRSLHVLNAISPAFTSSFRLAELIEDQVEISAS